MNIYFARDWDGFLWQYTSEPVWDETSRKFKGDNPALLPREWQEEFKFIERGLYCCFKPDTSSFLQRKAELLVKLGKL